ncbi:hypothetical protein LOTGIDRAFT_121500 [Lottia gigantea]|uniref:Glucose-6-phosphatase n=1 Tax=Lottia gigantea TaxID=225164 RepID=V3ZKX0_LOTGI|nr:hypothetical protein LOTGIDRAFT_121500 [Lottia gigantea]ESO92008.1 hypothetical protein LOTGIDRAFT_121500 [Lottia gigantea]
MDDIHKYGISVIQTLQGHFKNESSHMTLISHLSDPKNAFLIYFPVAFCLHQSVGKRVLLVAAVAEWLNAVFKWILHGERPYWWVYESGVYESPPTLDQFDITCETGPGSPSGHCMVTSSVIYILVSDFIFYMLFLKLIHFSVVLRCILWIVYGLVLVLVCLSRCFIAAHFPHQVIAGVIVGVVIGYIMNRISTTELQLKHYLVLSLLMLLGGWGTFSIIQNLGLDPFWSITKAKRRCLNPDWIHLDSSLFFSIIRDATSLIGLGLGITFAKKSNSASLGVQAIQLATSLTLALGSEWIELPKDPVMLFYGLSSVKIICIFFVIVSIIPRIFMNNNKKIK